MFDILVHLAGVRKNSCNEGEVISVSCFAALLLLLFLPYVERLIRFVVVGSSSAIDTGYSYVYDYLFTATVRVTNKSVGSTVIVLILGTS